MLGKKCSRFAILLIVELLLCLALLLGCFREEELVASFWGEDIAGQLVQVEDHVEYGSERVELTPGVYQIRVRTNLVDEQKIQVEMKCDASYFRALRGNSVTVFAGDNYEDFNIYVVDKTATAYVQCNFYGVDTSALELLEIYTTNLGNRIMVFLATIFFVALDLLIVFRRRILEGKVTKKQQVVFWTLTAGVFLAYFPYLTDYFFFGYDTAFHLSRIAYLKDSLQQGISFPVRMQSTWLYDHGYPVSMFYGDLFLYFPAFLMLIGFSIMTSYKMFIFVVSVATALTAYHSFKKCVKDEYAALFGSLIYLLAPYRLLNVYGRGAVGEFLAMIFLPLICCGMYLLYTDDGQSENYKKHKWYVILGVSGVLECHLLSAEMAVVFMALVCVMFWKKTFRGKMICQLLETVGITLLINAWFWVPLLCMMSCDSYNLQKLTQADVQSRGLLLGSLAQLLPSRESIPIGVSGLEPAHLGAGSVMLLIDYMLWNFSRSKSDKKNNQICNTLVGLTTIAVVLCTRYLPWNAVVEMPGIGFLAASLQFPWRWMSPATVLVSFFAVFFFMRVKNDGGGLVKAAIGIVAVVTIGSSVYQVNKYALESKPIYLYSIENIGTINLVSAEYLLLGTDTTDVYHHDPVAEEGLVWSDYEKNGTNVKILLENTTAETRYIEIPLIGYKGYNIETTDVGTESPIIAEERGTHGDLRIAVSSGYKGTIYISYEGFPAFHVAEVVSLITLIVVLGTHLYQRKKRVQDGN